MTANGAKKRANPSASAEPSPPAKRSKPIARGRKDAKKGKAANAEAEESDYEEAGSDAAGKVKPANSKGQKRVKLPDKPVEAMPAFARNLSAKVLIGAHVSAAGGSTPSCWLQR
jgi:hypothetical protein